MIRSALVVAALAAASVSAAQAPGVTAPGGIAPPGAPSNPSPPPAGGDTNAQKNTSGSEAEAKKLPPCPCPCLFMFPPASTPQGGACVPASSSTCCPTCCPRAEPSAHVGADLILATLFLLVVAVVVVGFYMALKLRTWADLATGRGHLDRAQPASTSSDQAREGRGQDAWEQASKAWATQADAARGWATQAMEALFASARSPGMAIYGVERVAASSDTPARLKISGRGFSERSVVLLGSERAPFVSATVNELVVDIPANGLQVPVAVTVLGPGGKVACFPEALA